MARLLVRDLMTDNVVRVRPEDSLARVQDLMDEFYIRHLPVVDRDGCVIGIVSQRDLLRHAVLGQIELPLNVQQEMMARTRVQNIMTPEPECAEPDQDLRDVADLMLERKYGCMPVCDGRRLIGIITESDFVRHYAERG